MSMDGVIEELPIRASMKLIKLARVEINSNGQSIWTGVKIICDPIFEGE